MTTTTATDFEKFLLRHDEGDAWARALDALLPSVHEVDRNALRIWFAFFPLALARALEQSGDPDALARKLLLQGNYRLRDQIDTSHTFLYGHRFWPEAKRASVERADSFTGAGAGAGLTEEILSAARAAAADAKADESLLVAVAAVAFMTIRQAGLEAFRAAPGEVSADVRADRRKPIEALRERARDDSQGPLGFLRTTDKRWTVVWDERRRDARFKLMHRQEVASASPNDTRDWSRIDPRCTVDEDPIPVQCRSASCGTCWVGVLGGAEKLSPVEGRERKVMRQLGYIDTDEARPLIRLSCQARGEGAVSIRIPPWNGVFGKLLRAPNAAAADEAAGGDAAAAAGD
ncbi:MAG: (2Fe-2S)-binding protein [Acidobacteria bacterium]|nr:(2Fe-2S)-binding protein [Acidobacteriota bacterium]